MQFKAKKAEANKDKSIVNSGLQNPNPHIRKPAFQLIDRRNEANPQNRLPTLSNSCTRIDTLQMKTKALIEKYQANIDRNSTLKHRSQTATPDSSSSKVLQRAIKRYDNLLESGHTALTNDSTSDVAGIGNDIISAKAIIAEIPELIVYAGYHGDGSGQFAEAFNSTELGQVDEIAKQFKNIKALIKPNQGLSDQDMKDSIAQNNNFFTWCYSDRRIKKLQEQ